MPYRPEIDGLRAVAVLAVVLFHALGAPTGGFAGVDVFFVISGYVITRVIAADLEAGRFSIAEFYVRRVRRIAPALSVTIAVTAAAAVLILLPMDLESFGRSVIGAALMGSNVVFWKEAGYFDAAAHSKPLLHTWSLGVEEQFYLIYPLLIAALWRSARRLVVPVLIVLCATSFGAAVFMAATQPAAAFFLIPFRFWEMGLGGLIALRPLPRLQGPVFAGAGLAMMAASFVLLDETASFPGLPALLPTLGAALVINGAHGQALIARVLGARPLVFLGAISYSLYLVHWPLIVLIEYRQGALLGLWQGLAVIAASVVLATLSWRFVEQPFRRTDWRGRRLALFGGAGAAAALCCAVGAALLVAQGLPGRLPARAQEAYALMKRSATPGGPQCFIDTAGRSGPSPAQIRAGDLCKIGVEKAQPDFVVWGDSHAGAMAAAIGAAAARAGSGGVPLSAGACPPILGYVTPGFKPGVGERCQASREAVIDLIAEKNIPLVFMVARWPRCALGTQFGNEGPFFDPATVEPPVPGEAEKCEAALRRTLAALDKVGAHAIIVLDVPEPGHHVPYAMAKALIAGRSVDLSVPLETVTARSMLADTIVRRVAAEFGAEVIDPKPFFCDARACRVQDGDTPLYRDQDHISRDTALKLSPIFDPVFQRLQVAQSMSPKF